MCEENITPSSLKLGCCLRPSWHQRVPHRLQQGGAAWLLTEFIKFYYLVFCRFNKELQHQIHYLEVSGTGEAWSPQSPGHFQRGFFNESQESRSSKSSAPSVYLAQRISCSIVTLLSVPLLSFILFPPLALEELCVTIEAGRCFQNLERREFKRLD